MLLDWLRNDPIVAILYIMAVPASVILVLQTLLTMFGMGFGHDADFADTAVDVDGDGSPDIHIETANEDGAIHDGDAGLRLITFRGIVAFFAVGGWSGLAAMELGASRPVAIIAAFLMGFAALILVAVFFKGAMRLQYNGTLNMSNAVGRTGEIYLTVPANAQGSGKISVVVQERMIEAEAITYADRDLRFGEKVVVNGIIGMSTLIVSPLSER